MVSGRIEVTYFPQIRSVLELKFRDDPYAYHVEFPANHVELFKSILDEGR